jgi:hypothetical protein
MITLLIAGAVVAWVMSRQGAPPPDSAPHRPAPAPQPTPPPRPCPGPGPCPHVREAGGQPETIGAKVNGRQAEDGTQIDCDLPGDLHLKNCGGSDGSGLCVFTSISHSARWQQVAVLEEFRDWMRKHPGGGYPSKVDKMIAQICQEKGVPVPAYVQVEGGDLEVLRAACRGGRMPAVTYSFSPTGRYGGSRISHMVSLVHADERHFVVLDNNYPGSAGHEDTYEWLSPEEFQKTYTGGGGGWCVVLLEVPPPPPPHNGAKEER